MAHIAALDAADHGVGFASDHRKRGDHGSVGTHHGASGIGRDAVTAGRIDVGLDIGTVARIVLGIDEVKVLAGPDQQTEALDARLHHRRAADQDGTRQILLQHHLRGPQHALVLAFGIDHADRLGLGLGKHRLHDEAGTEGKALQLRAILLEARDGSAGNTRFHGRSCDRGRNAQDQPRIERARDQRARAKPLRFTAVEAGGDRIDRRIARELGDGIDRGLLHLLIDRGGADVERAAEDEGKAQDVVDLVREVRAPGADHRVGPRFARFVRHDLRVWIGQRHDQRMIRHRLDHLGLQHVGRGDAQENVCAADHLSQRALLGFLRIDRLPAVHQRVAALMHHAVNVADPDVLALRAERNQQIETGDRRSTSARGDDLDVGELLAVQQQSIGDGGADNDGRAMLIVMEDRDLHALLQPRLDLEAFGSLDVLQIDAAERRLQRRNGLHHAVDGVGRDFDVEDVDPGEFLEQDRLAFHDRL